MPHYFTRIELHEAGTEEYDHLYKEMSELGYSKDFGSRKLPKGCYTIFTPRPMTIESMIQRIVLEVLSKFSLDASITMVMHENSHDLGVYHLQRKENK